MIPLCFNRRITTQSVNSLSGLLRAADAREASYTYINHVKYKTAKYSGMWMFGQPHGRYVNVCVCLSKGLS